MRQVLYDTLIQAVEREQLLTEAGILAGYFPENERYDIGGLMTFHPTNGKAAIAIFESDGVPTPLSEPDIKPCNYEPLFTDEERARAINELPADWAT